MKKLTLFLIVVLTIFTSGCAKYGNTGPYPVPDRKRVSVKPFKGADTDSSALTLCKYDGESTAVFYLYDAEQERKIIDLFNDLPLYEADIYEVTELSGSPAYALSIYVEEGERAVTWIESFCIDETGGVYLSNMMSYSAKNFEKLLTDYPWEDSGYKMEGNHLPNRYYLANRGEWDVKYLNKSGELKPRGLSIEIAAHSGSVITAKLTNITDEENGYPEYFSVQAKIGGEWYDIPAKEDMAFNDIAWLLPAGESREKQYDYSWYGDLPKGTYRLVVEGSAAEFEIE